MSRRPTRRFAAAAAVLVAVLVAVVVAGCGSSGRELPAPPEGAVSPTRSTSTTAAATSVTSVAPVLTLTSPAFEPGAPIPAEFSCNGQSPPLSWNVPVFGVSEVAISVTDQDAGDFVHWLVVDIPPKAGSVPAGTAPPGGTQLANSSGQVGWFGPCPPPGKVHTYNFTLYSLLQPFDIAPGTSPAAALQSLRTAAGARVATYSGTFER